LSRHFDEERTNQRIPSISVALLEGGRVSFCERGQRSMSSGEAVGPGTRYQAASISKTIAALAAPSLAIEGRLSLDEDVAQYLKCWRLPALPPGSSRPVTLRRLFGMTAAAMSRDIPATARAHDCPTMCRSFKALHPQIRCRYAYCRL
jgi:CubicO group peptidase (beta-lactamase class C family)